MVMHHVCFDHAPVYMYIIMWTHQVEMEDFVHPHKIDFLIELCLVIT